VLSVLTFITIDEKGMITVDSPLRVVLRCGSNMVELSPSGVSCVGRPS
jgi:hypothetical protein